MTKEDLLKKIESGEITKTVCIGVDEKDLIRIEQLMQAENWPNFYSFDGYYCTVEEDSLKRIRHKKITSFPDVKLKYKILFHYTVRDIIVSNKFDLAGFYLWDLDDDHMVTNAWEEIVSDTTHMQSRTIQL